MLRNLGILLRQGDKHDFFIVFLPKLVYIG